MLLLRAASPALAPFVERLWLYDEPAGPPGFERERVLPGRTIQIVVRLGEPLQVFDEVDDARARPIGHAVVSGAHSRYFVRDTSKAQRCVGARIHPAAAQILVGAPGDELAERHTPLEAIWGRAAANLREQLLETRDPHRQLAVFEARLLARLSTRSSVHPVVRQATRRLAAGVSVREVVVESGYSHRAFIALFRRAVGLPPKVYARVLRFRRSLDILAGHGVSQTGRGPLLARVAFEAGYADHAHLSRELKALSGLSPRDYLRLAPDSPTHVPVPRPR
jgi:AraC-like DNA-binding protein